MLYHSGYFLLYEGIHAKKSNYRDCTKYVIFTATVNKGKDTDCKVKATIYDTYHNLWRIKEFIKIIKSQLLQFKIMKNNYCSEDMFEFIHDFRVAKISDRNT